MTPIACRLLFVLTCTTCGSHTPKPAPAFRSDTEPAYREIERLQGLAYATARGEPRYVRAWQTPAEMRAVLDKIYAGLKDAQLPGGGPALSEQDKRDLEQLLAEPLPTRYEDPKAYAMLRLMGMLLDRARRNLGFDTPRAPTFGSLPLPSLNAECRPVPRTNDYVIILDRGVFDVVKTMTSIAIQTIEVRVDAGNVTIDHTDAKFRERLEQHPELERRLARDLRFWVVRDVDRNSEVQLTREELLLGTIDRAMYLFIIGHEYGHAIRNHVPVEGARAVETLAFSWAQELEADQIGFELMAEVIEQAAKEDSAENLKVGFHLMAPLLALEYVRLTEETAYIHTHRTPPPAPDSDEQKAARTIVDLLRQGNGKVDWAKIPATWGGKFGDHPPTWLRWSILAAEIDTRIRVGRYTDLQLQWAVIARALGENMHTLWDETAPHYLELSK